MAQNTFCGNTMKFNIILPNFPAVVLAFGVWGQFSTDSSGTISGMGIFRLLLSKSRLTLRVFHYILHQQEHGPTISFIIIFLYTINDFRVGVKIKLHTILSVFWSLCCLMLLL